MSNFSLLDATRGFFLTTQIRSRGGEAAEWTALPLHSQKDKQVSSVSMFSWLSFPPTVSRRAC